MAEFFQATATPARENRLAGWLCIAVVALALFLGGGTAGGFLGDVVVQLAAIALLVLWIVARPARGASGGHRFDLLVCAAVVLVPAAQLAPLPPGIWASLPQSALALQSLQAAGLAPGWRPLSLNQETTAVAALSLLAPAAVFLAMLLLDAGQRRSVAIGALAVAGASVFLGLAQVADGPRSALRPFEVTNPTEAVGFFANRNHYAASLYVALVLACAFAIDAGINLVRDRDRRFEPGDVIALAGSLTLMLLLASAQLIARSRAGIALTLLAGLGVAILLVCDSRNKARRLSLKILGGGGIVLVLFMAQLGVGRLFERLQENIGAGDTRLVVARATIKASQDYLPFGSGIGTFRQLYAIVERREDMLANTYLNQAHDDLLQLWLESGFIGALALALFAAWFARRSIALWLRPGGAIAPGDLLLARAAMIAAALLLLHSLLDYPLRTTAGMALFAMCCGLMARARDAVPSAAPAEEPVLFPPQAKGGRQLMIAPARRGW